MAGTKEIKRRIKSVKNTKKITKAMELVAASKMRKVVAQTLASRLYAGYSWELLTSLTEKLEEINHPFFTEQKRPEGKTLIVLITSNGSLCGGYNTQVIKKTLHTLMDLKIKNNADCIAIGKKGDSAMRRAGLKVIASFTDLPDMIGLRDTNPISKTIIDEYKNGDYNHVYVAYTDFVSALTQTPNIRKILPISKTELKEVIESIGDKESKVDLNKNSSNKYLLEGDKVNLIESLAEKLIRMQVYQMIVESNSSEQSARMVAMKNANEAAGEMIDSLTLVFNKARQAGITQEISEISAGMASIS